MFTMSMVMSAENIEIDGICYKYNPKTKLAEVVKSETPYEGNITKIREKIMVDDVEYDVTAIGESAFAFCKITSVIIPSSISKIDVAAFCYTSISSIEIPNSVKIIGEGAFSGCEMLKEATIPSSVETIERTAFMNCSQLEEIVIPNSITTIEECCFCGCENLKKVVLPNSLQYIKAGAFYRCAFESLELPNSIVSIAGKSIDPLYGAFSCCKNLKEIILPDAITNIAVYAFYECSALKTVYIPSNVSTINASAFEKCEALENVYCYAIEPPYTHNDVFKDAFIEYTNLYVPENAIDNYKSATPWMNFKTINAINGTNIEKCDNPTITYINGELKFACATEGAEFVSEITDTDVAMHYNASISLTATYYISVYATKSGYANSDVVTATLCWINAEPKTEGINNSIANVRAYSVLIQNYGNVISVSGADSGTPICVYDVSGKIVGSTTVSSETTYINTNLTRGQIGIIKIGEKSVKLVVR